MTTRTPRNAQEANAQATRLQRARQIITDGYTFTDESGDGYGIAVCKPGRLAASYWITDGNCDCPDAIKGNYCKHEIAWSLLQDEAEQDMWESICEDYDRQEAEEEVFPVSVVQQVIERLQCRIVQELEKAEARHRDGKPGYRVDEARKVSMLSATLETIGEYWGKECCGRLELLPAEEVTL